MLLSAIIVLFLLINCGNLKEPVTDGTGIVADFSVEDYRFTPMMDSETVVISQNFKPAHTGLSSISIRLANEWPDDVDCVLHFIVRRNDTVLDEYYVDSSDILNWRYLTLDLKNEYTCGLTYTLCVNISENNGGIPFKIFLCNNELKENKTLFINGEEADGELDLMYGYNCVPFYKVAAIILFLICAIIVSFSNPTNFQSAPIQVIIFFGSSLLCLLVIEYLQYEFFTQILQTNAFLLNYGIICGINAVLLAITGSFISTASSIVLLSLFGLINHYVLIFRGSVFLLSDILAIGTAANVVENYSIAADINVLIAVSAILTMVVLLLKSNRKTGKKVRIFTGTAAVAVLAFLVCVCVNRNSLSDKLDCNVNLSAQTTRSREIGFLLNTAENIQYFIMPRPNGYSRGEAENTLNDYTEQLSNPSEPEKVLPNLIFIMNESFTDLAYLGDLQTSTEYLGCFNELANGPDAQTGRIVVPVFGGGTSSSEFEFLTGYSMLFLGSGYGSYEQFVHKEIPSMLTALPSQYECIALHAATPKSWDRDKAYPRIGFDKFLSIDDEFSTDVEYTRYWVNDASLFQRMSDLSDSLDTPFLQFGITIQCHGGYDYEGYEATVHILNLSQDYPNVDQYLSLVRETDWAFGDLIESIQNDETPTIVFMFGDHLPSLGESFYSEMLGQGMWTLQGMDNLQIYETPYIIWSNYGADFSNLPELISANFIMPYIFQAADIPLDEYGSYLYELSQKYPVVSRSGILDNEGKFHTYTEEDECYQDLLTYNYVQYSRMHG